MKTPLLMFVAGLVFLSAANVLQAADPADEFFESHVRPILVEHCQECHGSKKQWAELRLDSHSFMMKGGENGPVVVPGKPEESRLIQVIHYSDDDSQMPPDGKLADEQIARLTEWITAGAHWPAESAPVAVDFFTAADAHWAFQPITSHPVPAVPETARVAGPIDSFVVARLQQAGLQQSERADPRTQLRRLALDLTGLPPSFEDVQAFTADSSEEAWSKVIDRYLSSPTFGQKWARHWLDLARYADTKGYVFTEERRYPFAYTYRDYVVDAFNRDLPYDLFITEQLAADLIPDRRDDGALAAMGFLTVGNRFLNQTSEIYDDRIDVTIRGLMGLTITCARCHDHKFDPIEMGDYYALRGVFDSSVEPEQLPQIGESNDPQAYAGFQAEKEKLEAKLNEFQVEKATAISQEVGAHMEHYLLAIAVNRKFTSGLYTLEEKYEVRNRFRDELYRFLAAQKVEDPFFGPIRQVIHLNIDNYDNEAPKRIEAVYKQLESGSFVANELLAARLQQSRPVTFFDFAKLYGPLISTALAEESTWPETEKEAWRALREHLKATQFPVPFSPESVTGYFNRDESNGRRERIKNVDNLIATSPGAPPHAMVLNDKPNPSNPFIFKRGNPGMRGDAVPRRFLKVLDSVRAEPFSNQSSGRLELAQAIASRDNPLTARVFVNRVWMLLIGAPLVSDTSDFGLRT
ncbi:MAG: DUF1549 domain-containing protein, partial [Planctomycetaceae bacterium]|nr:DUF1549 domain-containing protein [Planctomycetaceae bacterium]